MAIPSRRRMPDPLVLFLASTGGAGAWTIGYQWGLWPLWSFVVVLILAVPAVPVFMTLRRRAKVQYWQARGRREHLRRQQA